MERWQLLQSGRLLVADSVFLAGPNQGNDLSLIKYFDGGTQTSAYAYFLHDYTEGAVTAEGTMTMLQRLSSRMPYDTKKLSKSLHEYYARKVEEDGTVLGSKKKV